MATYEILLALLLSCMAATHSAVIYSGCATPELCEIQVNVREHENKISELQKRYEEAFSWFSENKEHLSSLLNVADPSELRKINSDILFSVEQKVVNQNKEIQVLKKELRRVKNLLKKLRNPVQTFPYYNIEQFPAETSEDDTTESHRARRKDPNPTTIPGQVITKRSILPKPENKQVPTEPPRRVPVKTTPRFTRWFAIG